jgi:hypothetical protein
MKDIFVRCVSRSVLVWCIVLESVTEAIYEAADAFTYHNVSDRGFLATPIRAALP